MDTKTSQKVSISPANIDLHISMLGKAAKRPCIEFLILMILWFWSKSVLWFWSNLRQVIHKIYSAQISNFRYAVLFAYRKICTTFSLYFEVNCCRCINVYLSQKWLCEQHACCPLPIEETQIFWICFQTLNNFPPLKNAMASASLWFISMHWLFYHLSNIVGKGEGAFLERQCLT